MTNKQNSIKLFSILGTLELLGEYVEGNYITPSNETMLRVVKISDIVNQSIFDDISMMNATTEEIAEFIEEVVEKLLNEVEEIESELNQNI